MTEEIKEIFDIKELFEEWKQFLSWCYENNDKTVEIHRDKLKWTMNYITNLQEKYEEADYDRHKLFDENQKLNRVIDKFEEWLNFKIEDYIKNEIIDFAIYKDILNKLTELKGDSDEKVESEVE